MTRRSLRKSYTVPVPAEVVTRIRAMRREGALLAEIRDACAVSLSSAHTYARGCHPSEQPGFVEARYGQRRARP